MLNGLCFITILWAHFALVSSGHVRQRGVPTLRSPEDRAVMDNGCYDRTDGVEWAFEWEGIPGASRYHLRVFVAHAENPAIDNPNIEKPSYRDRSPGGYVTDRNRLGWRWKVRAMVGGEWGEWSGEREFDVEPLDTDCSSNQKIVPIVREDCIRYNPEALEVIYEGERGWLLTEDGGRHRMLGLDNKEDAEAALALAKRHKAMCFIGRNNRRPNRRDYIVQYWK